VAGRHEGHILRFDCAGFKPVPDTGLFQSLSAMTTWPACPLHRKLPPDFNSKDNYSVPTGTATHARLRGPPVVDASMKSGSRRNRDLLSDHISVVAERIQEYVGFVGLGMPDSLCCRRDQPLKS
jgi:hypothetical protein